MPGPRAEGFMGGLLEGVAGTLYDRQKQKHDEALEANRTLAGVLLRGLDADPTRETATAVLPKVAEILHVPLQGLLGGAGSKGKGGKGSSPLSDPEAITGLFSGLASAFPARAELEAREKKALADKTDEQIRLERVKTDEKIREAIATDKYSGKPTITRVPGAMLGKDILGNNPAATTFANAPLDPNTFYERVQVKHGDQMTETYSQAPAPKEPANQAPGTFGDELKRREKDVGHTLNSKELLDLSAEWAKAHQAETPAQKLERAKELAKYRNSLKPAGTSPEFQADVTTTMTGAKYIDLSTYDIKTRQSARDWANANGVTPVSKEQGNALVAVDTARLNMQAMKDQILDKLPKDAVGRVTGGTKNLLSAYFQTDADLSSWRSWREGAIQTVRATQGVGSGQYRLTQQMVNLIINNDIPQLTDDVDTAQRKFDTVTKQLNDAEASIVVKDRSTLAAPQKPKQGASAAIPADVTSALKDKPNGRRYRVNGVIYEKLGDGTIRMSPEK